MKENYQEEAISIIICSLGDNFRLKSLQKVLLSLIDQINTNEEILVLSKSDNIFKRDFFNRIQETKLINILIFPNLNLAETRNKGLEIAKNKYVIFLDDDTIPSKNWLEICKKEIYNCKHLNIAGIGGKFCYPEPKTIFERFQKDLMEKVVYLGDFERVIYANEPFSIFNSIITGNAIYNKDIIKSIGFNPKCNNAGEDIDLAWKIRLKGNDLFYTPRLEITHDYSCTTKEFNKKFFKYGVASAYLTHFRHKFFEIDKHEIFLFFSNLFIYLFLHFSKTKYHYVLQWKKFSILTLLYHYLGKIYGSFKFGLIRL